MIGLNSINIAENVPLTLEETLNELLNYPEYLLPFMSHLMASKEEVSKTEHDERKVEEVKMLSEVNDPLLDLENCNLHELISILQKFASDPSIDVNQSGFGSYIANHVLKEKIARYNQEAMIPPKQKTAYEILRSDWSSDVCSSDLDINSCKLQFSTSSKGSLTSLSILTSSTFLSSCSVLLTSSFEAIR